MTLAAALKLVKRENWKPLPWLAVALALSGTAPARGECVSPSAAAGATTTTIYRCPEEDSSAGPPAIVDPGNSTVVERGAADVPWFGPKPTRTADPLAMPKAVSQPGSPGEVAKTGPVPVTKPAASEVPPAATQAEAPRKASGAVEGNTGTANAAQEVPPPPAAKAPAAAADAGDDEAASKAAEAEAADADIAEPTTTSAKRKLLKAKATKAKHAKTKHKKLKLAKSKRAKGKAAKKETAAAATGKTAKTAKREAKPEQVTTEPAKGDDKIILMTKKNMPLGSRIKNWLGL